MMVADISETDLSSEAIKYLTKFPWYKDLMLTEDMLSIIDATESKHFKKLTEACQLELKELQDECKERDCAYLRIIEKRDDELMTLAQAIANSK